MNEQPVHFESWALYGVTRKSACGVTSDKHRYTRREEHTTCRKCLKALGYDVN